MSSHRSQPTVPTASPADARARLMRLLRDRRAAVSWVVALSGASTAAILAGPALIGSVVDAVVDGRGRGPIDRAGLAFVLLALLGAAFYYLAGVRAAAVGENALVELREEVFDHVLALPLDVAETARAGELVSRVTGDVSTLARAVRHTVPAVVFSAIEAVLTFGALILLDVRLAAVALLAGAPAALFGGRWYLRWAPPRYRAEREARARWATGLLEAYRGRTTLTAYCAGPMVARQLGDHGKATVQAEMLCCAARNRLRPAVSTSLAMSLAAVVLAGAALADAETLSIGAVAAAALYVVRLFDPIGILLEEADTVQQATAAVARLVGVTQLPAAAGGSGVRAVSKAGRAGVEIELTGLSFGYSPGLPVVEGVNLRICSGERVVVIGPSGAGKSTLAKLICGACEPWSGQVRIGGIPVSEIDKAVRPSMVAMVAQEGHVFARSIADNVRLGRPDASEKEVAAALETVDALEWAQALPMGLGTRVGAGNHPLTPPQVQQLGLARVVCRNPAAIVLDEATANLDPVAAARTERHLKAALAGRTVVSVAHRLDTVSRADRVVVMEDGVVIECGPHLDLLAAGGVYARLWERWQSSIKVP